MSQTCDLVVARTASGSSDQPEVELFVNDIPVSVPPGTTVLQVTLAHNRCYIVNWSFIWPKLSLKNVKKRLLNSLQYIKISIRRA